MADLLKRSIDNRENFKNVPTDGISKYGIGIVLVARVHWPNTSGVDK